MPTLADALRVVNELETAGAISGYAIGRAMAMLFWAEPTVTFDLDVFVVLPGDAPGGIVSLEPIYRLLRARGCEIVAEHVVIARRRAVSGHASRIPRGALVAGRGAKRRERVALLRQADVIDESRLAALLQRHGIQSS